MNPRVILTTLFLPLVVACGSSVIDDRIGAGGSGGGGSGGSDTGPSCAADGDCAAPAICQLCADGVITSCAAGKCVEGACEVVYPGCPTPEEEPACPAEWSSANACTGDQVCTYGSESCCGETYASVICQCVDGAFGCHYTDACLGAPSMCPDPEPEVTCGGIAGLDCPGYGECVVSPSDCDDCIGHCECTENVDCDSGTFDPSPEVCACVAAAQD